jgi:hypothetical protein
MIVIDYNNEDQYINKSFVLASFDPSDGHANTNYGSRLLGSKIKLLRRGWIETSDFKKYCLAFGFSVMPISEQGVQECDATNDEQRTKS